MTKEELWQIVLSEIGIQISKANFNTWLKNTSLTQNKDGEIVISVPNAFTKEWLENKYNKLILKTLRNASNEIKEVKYVICNNATAVLEETEKGAGRQKKAEEQMNFQELLINQETNLNPKYVFESFIVGSNNELANAAALAITESIGTKYNPLFIYGGTGLGKTHLLQALGNKVYKDHKGTKKIKYVTSEKFTNEVITSIRTKEMDNFKNKYRKIDVLIIDDIQFLGGKEKTQEELFHIFNTLYERNKQIVFSSDRLPKEIPTIEDRLRSRFEGGMIADIGYPDLETRIAILKSKTLEKGFFLADEVLTFIAANFQSNIRELEGALNKIMAASNQMNVEKINVGMAEKILSDIIGNSKKFTSVKQIFKSVSDFYDIQESGLIEKNRRKEIVKPRQIAMYLLREELKYSYPYIGSKLGGRDHTTVIHSCEKIEKELKTNQKMVEEINLIKKMIYKDANK
ncbi:MAG: Chromosomal replication initiator protein DnaA [Candidatus Azambacteria bacterium GW2011_GWC1_46_13]|uniref:Chromosomal replication initiator protein DnaA n=1 Tax=Candidatus Azambacteria bacterium GW2011_GWC1_46_13 TaxID=1618619 RepID=A0A0G1NR96_9BACT|nr:MAG: Chromosomal replication initiator protein DnaA [Candidatus Azambacteria bacterium GW2011_GWC1_46_13]